MWGFIIAEFYGTIRAAFINLFFLPVMLRTHTLPNGLRVLLQPLASTKAVTALILVGAGSRYEEKKINGIAHFLEHMFFKGAVKYPNAKAVSETIDGVGGDFNAFTGKEYVGYYVKLAGEHVNTALDLLSDMLLHAKFDSVEIDKERGVIMEEYNMYQDTPMYQVGWNFERLLYGDQPMGWDQVGTKELIMGVTQADFRKYQTDLYTPENTVITIAGAIDPDAVLKKIQALFQFPERKKAYNWKPLKKYVSEKVHLVEKKTEQAHVVIGFPAYPEAHPDHYVLKVLATVLGGNMSSRMFLGVREKLGLSYYISTSTDDYQDSGVLSTRAGVDVKRVDLAIEAICKEYGLIRGEKIPAAELTKAKEFIKGKLILRLEDSEEYAHLLGKQALMHGTAETPAEVMQKVDAVTIEDLARVSADVLKPENLHLALIGPYSDAAHFESLLHF